MKQKNKPKSRWKIKKMPKLHWGFRLLLYLLMIVFAVLSLISVAFEPFAHITEIFVYSLAAVTLFAGSYYLTLDIRYGVKDVIKPGIAANPYTNRVASDYRLRTILFSVPGLLSNIVFAAFNAGLGIISHSVWLGSLAVYYILLSMMRIGAVRQAKKISGIKQKQSRWKQEILAYERSSVQFLFMALILTGMVVLLEKSIGGKRYPGIAIYAAATYSFYKITMSIVHVIKARKQNSLLLMAIRKIGYVDACVSILFLQTAMFFSFAQDTEEGFIKIMNGITGGTVCAIVFAMGIRGIWYAKKMKEREIQ